MNIDRINYFLETAKHEHLGRAAKALAISPSAISHAIKLLEEERMTLERQLRSMKDETHIHGIKQKKEEEKQEPLSVNVS